MVAASQFVFVAVLLAAATTASAQSGDAPLLHALFQDHAVLQRDQPIRIWGQARPGDSLQVDFAGSHVPSQADAAGRWQALLPAQAAGGPYRLSVTVSGGATQIVDDVLVGDVWLCSGQSNMELPVHRALDAMSEIAGANHDAIRLLTIPQGGSAAAREDFMGPVRWQVASPDSVRDFSATCYYFARELQKTVDVPLGLVSAAWGGSRIQAWISAEGLRTVGGYDAELDLLAAYAADPVAAAGSWGELWEAWWRARPEVSAGDEPWHSSPAAEYGWQVAPPTLGAWERWGVPALAGYNGMLWYRTSVSLSAVQAVAGARLLLGAADEVDVAWVNGRVVGSLYGPGSGRDYRLPDGLLHEGDNLVVVNVLDTYGEGGLAGPAGANALLLDDGTRIPLDGAWSYRIASGSERPPGAPWQSATGLSTLYNGMIAPIGRFGLRGIVWYQGESNTAEADRYAAMLRAFRADWRRPSGMQLPLLLVQLAGYGAAPTKPGESGWATLREAQRQVAADDANTGLAIAIDIGDRYDIHPPNKQELGRRLARVARHVVFAGNLPASGPVPVSATREGDAVVVAFGDISDGLVAYGADGPVGFELCGSDAGSCRYARAEIRGSEVLLRAALATPPTRVRYGWADSPVVTLFDRAGLPAGPFELTIPPATGVAP